MHVAGRFKGYFLRGLAVLLPGILTIWILIWGYTFINGSISVHISRGLVRLMVLMGENRIQVSDEQVRRYLLVNRPELGDNEGELTIHMARPDIRRRVRIEQLERVWVDGPGSIAGFVLALAGVCVVGAILTSMVGKTFLRMMEQFMMNTPVLRRVYPYVKQVTDFLLAQDAKDSLPFSRVVAVQYPRKGIWSLGLVTGSGLRKLADDTGRDLVTVFIATTPTPITGFVIMVPRKHVRDLDMTIEEAFRFIVSGGVIAPGYESGTAALPRSDEALAQQKLD